MFVQQHSHLLEFTGAVCEKMGIFDAVKNTPLNVCF